MAELKRILEKQQHEIQQALGKALLYPWYCDDQKNFPGATRKDGVCVGEHIAESLADEAADVIASMRIALRVIYTWADCDALDPDHVRKLIEKTKGVK